MWEVFCLGCVLQCASHWHSLVVFSSLAGDQWHLVLDSWSQTCTDGHIHLSPSWSLPLRIAFKMCSDEPSNVALRRFFEQLNVEKLTEQQLDYCRMSCLKDGSHRLPLLGVERPAVWYCLLLNCLEWSWKLKHCLRMNFWFNQKLGEGLVCLNPSLVKGKTALASVWCHQETPLWLQPRGRWEVETQAGPDLGTGVCGLKVFCSWTRVFGQSPVWHWEVPPTSLSLVYLTCCDTGGWATFP